MDASLLRRSAPLAWSAAPTLCHVDAKTGANCSWYHGPWQFFRLLGVVSTATVHEEMMSQALRALARDGNHARVLVSGTTDYAMLALAHDAYAQENAEFSPTAVDLCPTPLRLCQWYADEQQFALETHAGNILEYQTGQPFDVICTHAFMGYFDGPARAALLRRWHALLRPGGKLVTVQRLRPGYPDTLARFTPTQADAFRAKVLAEANQHRDLIGITPAALAEMAGLFAAHFVSYPIRSREEIDSLFTTAGFRLQQRDICQTGERQTETEAGPSVTGHAEFAHIVAVRD